MLCTIQTTPWESALNISSRLDQESGVRSEDRSVARRKKTGVRSEDLRSDVRKDHEDICPLSQSRPVSAGVKGWGSALHSLIGQTWLILSSWVFSLIQSISKQTEFLFNLSPNLLHLRWQVKVDMIFFFIIIMHGAWPKTGRVLEN